MSVADAVRADLDKLGVTAPPAGSLAAAALVLAAELDAGAGMAAAAVSRELRVIMQALAADPARAVDPEQELLGDLSAAVWDPAE
ncbi:MAG TPA: hypothetical protein VK923_11445 [Euzebyales bacterium]|nr:hypothetical protein [Euzebyales bacterium]